MNIPDRHFARRDDVIAAFSAAPALSHERLREDLDLAADPSSPQAPLPRD